MKPIVLIPFASEIHGEEYYGNVLGFFKKLFANKDVEIYDGVITSENDVAKVAERCRDRLPIALALTGGTSGLIYDLAITAPFDKLLILGHTEHNSLASAVSARGKIEREGFSAIIYWCDIRDPVNCELVVDKLMRIARAVSYIAGSKIAAITERGKGDVEEAFESRFNSVVDVISLKELTELMESINLERAREIMAEIEGKYVVETHCDSLEKVSRLYLALEKMFKENGYDVVAIDCFPWIVKHRVTPCLPLSLLNGKGYVAVCEADFTAVVGMMLAKSLTSMSGWIGNIVWSRSNRAMFAHCTIAMDISASKPRLIPHFETSYPYAVTSSLNSQVVTLVSVDRDFTYMVVDKGRVVKSGLMTPTTCRTQVLLEFDHPVDHLPIYAPSNHHVLLPGDHMEELMDIAYMFNMDIVTYRELAGYR